MSRTSCALSIWLLIFCILLALRSSGTLAARGGISPPLEDVGLAVYQEQADFQLSPLYYAQANGLYTQQGVRLTIYYAGSVTEALRLLEQGRVHGALLPAVSTVRSIYNSRQLGIFMQYMHQSPYAIIATSLSDLREPAQLVGKRIGLEAGNFDARLALQVFLQHYRLNDRVEVLQTPTDPLNQMLNRQIDAAISNRIQAPGLLDGQDFPYFVWQVPRRGDQPLPGDVFVALRSYLSDQNRALLRRFSQATLKAMKALVRNPDRTAWDVVLPYEREFSVSQIIALQRELTLLGEYIQGEQDFRLLGTATAGEYNFLLQKMQQLGMIRQAVPGNRLFVF